MKVEISFSPIVFPEIWIDLFVHESFVNITMVTQFVGMMVYIVEWPRYCKPGYELFTKFFTYYLMYTGNACFCMLLLVIVKYYRAYIIIFV